MARPAFGEWRLAIAIPFLATALKDDTGRAE
jgi:hypothetical protein